MIKVIYEDDMYLNRCGFSRKCFNIVGHDSSIVNNLKDKVLILISFTLKRLEMGVLHVSERKCVLEIQI